MSFCIDFSGSTNLVLLPSATASTTLGTMTRTDVAGFADTNEGGRGGGSAGPEGNGEGGEKLEICGEVDSMHGVDETVATVGESHGATVSSGGASPLSARVSAEAFCRTILARVTVQDPEATGTIKVSAGNKIKGGIHPPRSWGWLAAAYEYVASNDATALSGTRAEMAVAVRGTEEIICELNCCRSGIVFMFARPGRGLPARDICPRGGRGHCFVSLCLPFHRASRDLRVCFLTRRQHIRRWAGGWVTVSECGTFLLA